MSRETIPATIVLIDHAEAMTREMRNRDPRSHLFDFAEQQLALMRKILATGRIPTDDEKRQIGLGRMAIHEFEGGPLDDYATALEEASGAFHLL